MSVSLTSRDCYEYQTCVSACQSVPLLATVTSIKPYKRFQIRTFDKTRQNNVSFSQYRQTDILTYSRHGGREPLISSEFPSDKTVICASEALRLMELSYCGMNQVLLNSAQYRAAVRQAVKREENGMGRKFQQTGHVPVMGVLTEKSTSGVRLQTGVSHAIQKKKKKKKKNQRC